MTHSDAQRRRLDNASARSAKDEALEWRTRAAMAEQAGLRALIDGLAHEMERTLCHRETKGGVSGSDHGDFCSAPPSMLGRMRWWVREMREALGGQTSRLLARARNEGLEKAATLLERLASNADMAADAAPNSKIRLEHAVEAEGLRTHAAVVRTMKEPEE